MYIVPFINIYLSRCFPVAPVYIQSTKEGNLNKSAC